MKAEPVSAETQATPRGTCGACEVLSSRVDGHPIPYGVRFCVEHDAKLNSFDASAARIAELDTELAKVHDERFHADVVHRQEYSQAQERIATLEEALRRCEYDFDVLITRGDLTQEPRAHETLRIIRAALKGSSDE